MKYILVFFMVLFSYADIIESKIFSKNIKSNLVDTTLAISLEDKNIASLVNKIDNMLKIVNNYHFCKNNSYSILPKYSKNKFISYNTKLKLQCQFKNNKINIFTELLNKVQKNNIIYIHNLKYIIPKNLQKNSVNNLKIEALNYGIIKAQKLSKTFKQKCFMQKVDFNSYSRNILYKRVSLYQESMPLPQNHGKNIELKANYKFICF